MSDAEAGHGEAAKKILCVEDSEDGIFMLHRRLTRAGYDVKVSANGKEAIEWAKHLQPDLIVMDLNLPGMNGLEATRHLKSQAETKQIPIIVLTAHTSKRAHDDAIAAGCDDFDTKPIDFPGLVTKVQALLARGASK